MRGNLEGMDPHTNRRGEQVPQTIDLTGLPDRVVRQVRDLVEEARRQQAAEAGGAEPGPRQNGPAPGGESEAFPLFISRPQLTDAEFQAKLDELASMGTGKVLPADFSRVDVYDDHD